MGVNIDQQHPRAAPGQRRRDLQGQGGFTHAALLIQERQDHRISVFAISRFSVEADFLPVNPEVLKSKYGRPPSLRTGPAATPEPPPLTTEDLVARAHARRQGIPYETGERLLEQLPERLRALADLVLSGKARTGDVVYAVAALIDMIESAPADAGPRWY